MKRRFAVWSWSLVVVAGVAWLGLAQSPQAGAGVQTAMSAQTTGAGHRTRLILKDGSYQIVMSYQV